MNTLPRCGLVAIGILTIAVPLSAGQRGGGNTAGRGLTSGQASPSTSSAGLSISRPIGTGITSVRTNPPPGIDGPHVRSPFDARPGTYTRLSRTPLLGYGVPYGYDTGASAYGDADSKNRGVPHDRFAYDHTANGVLYPDVTPRTAQVFVDSAYVGSAADLMASGVRLAPGRHWLDVEAPDFDRRTVEINIASGQPLRYQTDLTPTRRAVAALATPPPPQTIYTIPFCYGGNRPPVAANLPANCDIKNVRVVRPQPRAAN